MHIAQVSLTSQASSSDPAPPLIPHTLHLSPFISSVHSVPSSPALAQALTQSEFYEATWAVVNSPSTSVTKWGPIEDWDTSGVPSFANAFTTYRNEAGGYEYNGNPKAATFNGDISKWITTSVKSLKWTFGRAAAFNGDVSAWITSSVTSMTSTFSGASSFTGTGVDLWNINKMEMRKMSRIFEGANENEPSNALTSCSKRKIADAW